MIITTETWLIIKKTEITDFMQCTIDNVWKERYLIKMDTESVSILFPSVEAAFQAKRDLEWWLQMESNVKLSRRLERSGKRSAGALCWATLSKGVCLIGNSALTKAGTPSVGTHHPRVRTSNAFCYLKHAGYVLGPFFHRCRCLAQSNCRVMCCNRTGDLLRMGN